MSAFIIRNGEMLQSNADIDVLIEHVTKRVKVKTATVLSYTNGYSVLQVSYSDGAAGLFNGISAPDLAAWADGQKGWPKATLHRISMPLPLMDALPPPEAEEVEEEDVDEPPSVVVRRTRQRPGVRVRIQRSRGAQ